MAASSAPSRQIRILTSHAHSVLGIWTGAQGFKRPRNGFAFAAPARQIGTVTSEQMAMISSDPVVMHGQAVIAGTRVPVSVILDCLAAGMITEQITAEYPTVTALGVRAAAAYGAALARGSSNSGSITSMA